MSTDGSSTPTGSRRFWNSTTRTLLITWAIVILGMWLVTYFTGRKDAALRDDLSDTRSSVQNLSKAIKQGDPAVASELSTLRNQFERLSQQLATYEQALGGNGTRAVRGDGKASEVESQRAIQRAKATSLSTQVRSIRKRLAALSALQATWQASNATLMTGDPGRRIAASPSHLKLALGALNQERTTTEQIQLWESQLNELAAPIEQLLADDWSLIALKPEHETMIADLGQKVSQAASRLEHQQLLIEAIQEQTADVTPAALTLEQVIQERESEEAVGFAQRMTEEHNRKLEAERAKSAQAILDAQTENERQVRELELAAIKANAQIKTQKIKDAIAQVEREEERRQADLKTQIENEIAEAAFERSLPEIHKYLSGFITPGHQQLNRGRWVYTEEKQPLSLGALTALRVLEQGGTGQMQLATYAASRTNDRPGGAFSGYLGGHVPPGMEPDIVRAQNLLKQFGDLLVDKGMLLR